MLAHDLVNTVQELNEDGAPLIVFVVRVEVTQSLVELVSKREPVLLD
jgi:hypothetical protein